MMKCKIGVVIFTHKRALQLDALVSSIVDNFQSCEFPIRIIYDYNTKHKKSYNQLKIKWGNKITFHKISRSNLFNSFNLFLNPFNLLMITRWPHFFFKYNNFKFLLEKVIKNKIKSKFVTMMTDDTLIINKLRVPRKALMLLSKDPNKYTYKFYFQKKYFGKEKKPLHLILETIKYKNNKGILYKWHQKSNILKKLNVFWNYRFVVDATIYEKKSLSNFLSKIIYNCPSTLESNGNWYAQYKSYYTHCLSNLKRSYISLELQNLQKLIDTPASNFDTEILMKKFSSGYIIDRKKVYFPKFKAFYAPKKLILRKSNEDSNLTLFSS